MKKAFIAAALLLFAAAAFSRQPGGQLRQGENHLYRAAIDHLERQYNAGQYDSIYNGFARFLRQNISQDSTVRLFAGLKESAGDMRSSTFQRWANKVAARYVTVFERDTMIVSCAVDSDGSIIGFKILPYNTQPAAPKQ